VDERSRRNRDNPYERRPWSLLIKIASADWIGFAMTGLLESFLTTACQRIVKSAPEWVHHRVHQFAGLAVFDQDHTLFSFG
jgi:hypothetical protein